MMKTFGYTSNYEILRDGDKIIQTQTSRIHKILSDVGLYHNRLDGVVIGSVDPKAATVTTLSVINDAHVGGRVYQGGYMLVPVGSIFPYAQSSAPNGYLLCDGNTYDRDSYPELFAVIGTTYGSDGYETFNVPDMRGKFPLGINTSEDLAQTGGSTSHTLSVDEMPSHGHSTTVNDPGHNHSYVDFYFLENGGGYTNPFNNNMGSNGGGVDYDNQAYGRTTTTVNSTTGISVTVHNTGGSQPLNIMNPYLSVAYIIKY